MKVFGSISRLVSVLFRKDSQDITLRPNQATTYTAARDMQLPPGDTAHVLMSATSTATMTNKTFDADGSGNSITNIENADIKAGAAIDAAKIHDGSVSNTEFGYLNGVTSAIQTQLDAKVTGPGSATDEAIVRYDGTTGKLVQNSSVTVSDAGALTAVGAVQSNTSLILQDPGAGTDTVTIQAPTLSGSYTLTLPTTDGNSNQVLQTDGSGVLSWVDQAGISSFAADWDNADGVTKTITHNLGTKDIQIEIYDTDTDETIYVDSVVRTNANTVDLTASEAPAVTWRVTIHAT